MTIAESVVREAEAKAKKGSGFMSALMCCIEAAGLDPIDGAQELAPFQCVNHYPVHQHWVFVDGSYVCVYRGKPVATKCCSG